ncbi:MAG: hypothetical protein AAF495_11480 [Pseudomonadota bacterium]
MRQDPAGGLPAIPVLELGTAAPVAMVEAERARTLSLVAAATRFVPRPALQAADHLSRRWLERADTPYLPEIAAVAEALGQPGGWFLNACYEWGCTSAVGPLPGKETNRLIRVLDWTLAGLGKTIVAARRAGPAGPWTDLTWPGYSGVIQALAPGRFAAAFNQAPMHVKGSGYLLDWARNRHAVWRRPALPPAHLLRRVFDQAASYAQAKTWLVETPLALPAIFLICGPKAGEACVIERLEDHAEVIEGPAAAANHWQRVERPSRPRGAGSPGRRDQLARDQGSAGDDFAWLRPPVLNPTTRLAMTAEPATGNLKAQGFEKDGPATAVLCLNEA